MTRLKTDVGTLLIFGISVAFFGCNESAPDDLILEEESTESIIFVKTKGSSTLNRSSSEGNIYKLSPISPDGKVTAITDYDGARISDPCVSWDGKWILFSMHPQGASNRNIYEIDIHGGNLRQVTAGGGHDFDPTYLPDGTIMFTSSRHREMDEYNFSLSEVLYTCDADGSNITRVSFNMSDDFDPAVLSDGRVVYTRWEHFGTMNRFPLFFTNPDGSKTFHMYGPHNRNFFHAQPTPDGRIIAVVSTRVNNDAGPIAVLKPERGSADPAGSDQSVNWDVLTEDVNTGGAPWAYGAFKYPFPLGGNRYIASYTLPAATSDEVDYGLYTFTLDQSGTGSAEDPASISLEDLTFLYNDPDYNEIDAQLVAPREKPKVIPPGIIPGATTGRFLAHNVFRRGTNDGQERPVEGEVDKIVVYVGIPTMEGESNNFSANRFERRALLGFAPVYEDGSFHIEVPADLPISIATLDSLDRAFVNKRTWIYARPGEMIDECTACHKDRGPADTVKVESDPISRTKAPTDLNVLPENYRYITYQNDLAPIVEENCAHCHLETYEERDSLVVMDSTWVTVTDTIAPPGSLDLTSVLDTTSVRRQVFPRAYINLSGASEMNARQVVVPAFPRRSILIDYLLGVGVAAASGPHPEGEPLLAEEQELFNLWVTLGAQYR